MAIPLRSPQMVAPAVFFTHFVSVEQGEPKLYRYFGAPLFDLTVEDLLNPRIVFRTSQQKIFTDIARCSGRGNSLVSPQLAGKRTEDRRMGMTPQVEFHFDFGSPNAYLSHLVIPRIEERTGVGFRYVPVLLGGVFKATNNVSPAVSLKGIKNKPEYYALETKRFLKKHAISAYKMNPYFPVNTLQLMRGAVFAQSQDYFAQYVDAVYHHMWAEPKKMDEVEVIRTALTSSGLPADAILEGMQQPEVKQQLIKNTEDAVTRGVFGSPSFFVGGELFFGKDKLAEVEEEIRAQQAA